MKKRLLIVCCVLCSLMACNSKTDTGTTLSGLKKADFDTTVSGKKVALYELKNKNGVEVAITNYGGRIVSIWVPDRNGKFGDIMLAHSYIADQGGNFGALIGRYGNRINQGRFILDGQEYQLPQNNYGHCLHGGDTGFHHRIWDATQPNAQTLVLSCVSPDGEAGFPGTMKTTVTYSLSDDNALQINYEAETDKPTIVNLTNHAYFNLSGDGKTTSPESGITLEVYTNEPGIQFYAGNFLDGTVKGKHGIYYPLRSALCLETQHYPDSPNKADWPSVVVRPGEKYHSTCIYKFGAE